MRRWGILPTSYILSPHLLNVDPEPFASGGCCEVYKGTLDGLKVCIKRVTVYDEDGPQKAKARYWRRRLPCPLSLTNLTAVLSRGRNVEILDTPKHRTPAVCHFHPLPTHFRMHVRWRAAGLY